jgi:hypothetical protein
MTKKGLIEQERDKQIKKTLRDFKQLVSVCRCLDRGQYYLPVMKILKESSELHLRLGLKITSRSR